METEQNHYNFDGLKWVKYVESLEEKVNWSYYYRPFASDIAYLKEKEMEHQHVYTLGDWQKERCLECELQETHQKMKDMIASEKKHLGIDYTDELYEKLAFNLMCDMTKAAVRLKYLEGRTVIHADEDDGHCD